MKINVYPRRVRRAKLDLQVGNHPALYLVIAKKNCYSSVIIASCFHIHENKKLSGSTIC